MGKISKGILGGFSGTVGSVVGGNWRGIAYIRSKPTTRKGTSSPAQDAQRARFRLAAKFLRSMRALLTITYLENNSRMTGTNSALAYTLKNAVIGVYPELKIDYTKTLIAKGELPNAVNPVAAATVAGQVNFTWTDNTGTGSAKATDKATFVAYSPETDQCLFSTANGTRSTGAGVLPTPSLSGKTVHTWIAFSAENGKDNSVSLYLGTMIIL